MGRFLREAGKVDKTRAGTMLTASGKTMSFIANQRILLRSPLVRLYQDIETFQYRAVTDTYETIDKMESARTAYRAALLWMKDISNKLDPDTYKQLEKFRKVQSHVRRCKARFEKIKIDTYQKIDMLSASRVNMFSHSLGLYQKEWLSFYEKSSKIMNEVNDAFAGYQYYDFNILKQLVEPQRKAIHAGGLITSDLEKKLNSILEGEPSDQSEEGSTSAGEDKLLFFESSSSQERTESSRKELETSRKKLETSQTDASGESDLLGLGSGPEGVATNLTDLLTDEGATPLDLTGNATPLDLTGNGTMERSDIKSKKDQMKGRKEVKRKEKVKGGKTEEGMKSSTLDDLLTAAEPDERELLNEIFAGPVIEASIKPTLAQSSLLDTPSGSKDHFLPSELLADAFSPFPPSSFPSQDLLSGDGPQIDLYQQLQSLKLPAKNQDQTKSQDQKKKKGQTKNPRRGRTANGEVAECVC